MSVMPHYRLVSATSTVEKKKESFEARNIYDFIHRYKLSSDS